MNLKICWLFDEISKRTAGEHRVAYTYFLLIIELYLAGSRIEMQCLNIDQ